MNAARHADASIVTAEILVDPEQVRVTVTDSPALENVVRLTWGEGPGDRSQEPAEARGAAAHSCERKPSLVTRGEAAYGARCSKSASFSSIVGRDPTSRRR